MIDQTQQLTQRQNYSPGDVEAVWRLGKIVIGYDSGVWRKDFAGAWICRSAYGAVNHKYGWEIDHIVPLVKHGENTILNVQPLHCLNNRSKGDDFPMWTCKVTSQGNTNILVS